MKVQIIVAAHKEFPMPNDTELYLPVLVGSAINRSKGIKYQRDDDGDNISIKNPNYNELTAFYWAWKNLSADAVGLVHYRRMLSLEKKRSMSNILNEKETELLLKETPIILPKKRHYYIETNYSHYVHAHHREPLDITKMVIEEQCPEYIKSFDKVMNSKSAHMFNMFIMKKDFFNAYADWLFSILSTVEGLIDISEYSVQESRVFGYLSELLLDVWLGKQKVRYREVYWIQLGERKLISKSLNFLKRKFGFKASTHF